MEQIDSLEFIFTTPTFVPGEVTDKVRREPKEFHIPQSGKEQGFFGTEFEIRLKNRLTQRVIARKCAEWIRRKAKFRSNRSRAPMQQFACVVAQQQDAVYIPLHGSTAVDLGYQPFNQRTQDGREMGIYSDLLTAAIRSIVQVKEEQELDSLFTGQKTTARTGPATGLDDFELIVFLVVEPTGAPA